MAGDRARDRVGRAQGRARRRHAGAAAVSRRGSATGPRPPASSRSSSASCAGRRPRTRSRSAILMLDLPGDPVRRDEPLRRRAVDAPRRRVRRLVRDARAPRGVRAVGRLGRAAAAGRSGRRAATSSAGPPRCCSIAIGSTAFDGAREGPLFNTPIGDLQQTFAGWGASLGFALEMALLVFLLVSIAVVCAIWAIVVLGMPRRSLGLSHLRARAAASSHTLIPIAAAYLVAHYFSALVYDGQAVWALVSDPLGHGSNIFGAATNGVDYSVVSATQHLVRPGRCSGDRPRRRPRARARPGAAGLRQPAGGDRVAGCHARGDGRCSPCWVCGCSRRR